MNNENKDKRIGNQFWKLVDPDKLGRPPNFKTPTELWGKCLEYFQECDESPILSEETTTKTGSMDGYDITKSQYLKVPYNWEGLYVFLEVCNLDHYKTKDEFSGIITHIGNVIRNQKLTGASIGLFNANIVARELGLTDKKEVENKGPIQINITKDEAKL